jgi:Yip1 domain
MSNTTTSTGAATASMSLPARFIGIVTSPGDTFRAVVAHPRWLGMLALVTVMVAIGAALPLTTEAGKEAALQTQVEFMEGMGMQVSDQAYEQMRRRQAFAPYTTAGGVLVGAPVVELFFAGILFVVFNVAMGGGASFKQVFAILVHSSVISALQQLFTGPLNYFRGAVTSATNLAVLLPMVDSKSFLGRVLAGTDLFLIWRLLVLAIGLAVLYKRRTQPIAITLLAIYAVIVLGFAAVMSSLS